MLLATCLFPPPQRQHPFGLLAGVGCYFFVYKEHLKITATFFWFLALSVDFVGSVDLVPIFLHPSVTGDLSSLPSIITL